MHRTALELEEFKITKPVEGKEFTRKLGMRARSKAKRIETPSDRLDLVQQPSSESKGKSIDGKSIDEETNLRSDIDDSTEMRPEVDHAEMRHELDNIEMRPDIDELEVYD